MPVPGSPLSVAGLSLPSAFEAGGIPAVPLPPGPTREGLQWGGVLGASSVGQGHTQCPPSALTVFLATWEPSSSLCLCPLFPGASTGAGWHPEGNITERGWSQRQPKGRSDPSPVWGGQGRGCVEEDGGPPRADGRAGEGSAVAR